MKFLYTVFCEKPALKIISFILGTFFWMMLNLNHSRLIQLAIPVCFYNEQTDKKITAPEQINITLQGTRNDLQTLDLNALAVHINADILTLGKYALPINSSTLFLPNSVKLLHYDPSNSIIEISNIHT